EPTISSRRLERYDDHAQQQAEDERQAREGERSRQRFGNAPRNGSLLRHGIAEVSMRQRPDVEGELLRERLVVAVLRTQLCADGRGYSRIVIGKRIARRGANDEEADRRDDCDDDQRLPKPSGERPLAHLALGGRREADPPPA